MLLGLCLATRLGAAAPLLAGPSAPSGAPGGSETQACQPDHPIATLGPPSAPRVLDAVIDPAADTAYVTWLQLTRLVAQWAPSLRVRVWFSGSFSGAETVFKDGTRQFVFAAGRRGRAQLALALVARHGARWVGSRLSDPIAAAQLAALVGLDGPPDRAGGSEACFAAHNEAALNLLRSGAPSDGGTAPVRLPALVLGDQVFGDVPQLTKANMILAGADASNHWSWFPGPGLGQILDSVAVAPDIRDKAGSAPEPRFVSGLRLGGVGLPHRLIVIAGGENDEDLTAALPLALALRHARAGLLSLEISASGDSLAAVVLGHRLCQAQRQGQARAYLTYLARPAHARRAHREYADKLLAALDAGPHPQCVPAQGATKGAWLDGQPLSGPQLEDALRALHAGSSPRSPLTPWLGPPKPQEPASKGPTRGPRPWRPPPRHKP